MFNLTIKIIKKEFEWSRPLQPLDTTKVTAIALHHMASETNSMLQIHQWHLDNGWAGFAYNYWIDYEGNIYECRGLNKGGGLYDPLNKTILSIGFQGDYDKSKIMPKAQYNAGVELIRYLKQLIPTIQTVNGHKYWQDNTSCPGTYFPLTELIIESDKIVNNEMPTKDFNQVANWAKDSVKKVINKGIMIGDDQGFFNPTLPMTRQEVAVVVSRLLDLIG